MSNRVGYEYNPIGDLKLTLTSHHFIHAHYRCLSLTVGDLSGKYLVDDLFYRHLLDHKEFVLVKLCLALIKIGGKIEVYTLA